MSGQGAPQLDLPGTASLRVAVIAASWHERVMDGLAAWHAKRWRNLWYGWLLLLPFQMLAVFAAAMKQILLSSGPSVVEQADWAQWQLEVVAYLYQFSTLIMPPVTALAVWIVLHRAFVEKFIGADMIALMRVDKNVKAQQPPRAKPMPKRP